MPTGKSEKHKQLQKTAIAWLYSVGCSVFAEEVPTRNGIADALGVKTRDEKHTIYYIEAKASRSDLCCFKQKSVYMRSIGGEKSKCYYHTFRMFPGMDGKNHVEEVSDQCENCLKLRKSDGDTGIDYYYLIVADGVVIEPHLYPTWGVINENGKIIRRAKRNKREGDSKEAIKDIAHVLVYKVFGKMYLKS